MENPPRFVFAVHALVGEDFFLEPFDFEKHAPPFLKGAGNVPSLYAFTPLGPYLDEQQFKHDFVDTSENDPGRQTYAILTTRTAKKLVSSSDATDHQYTLAGIVGYIHASKVHLRIEIGPIILLPQYHGIGLASSVVELMVQHAFKDPAKGGFGIHRIVWSTNAANVASIKLAERLNFRREGLLRWELMMRDGVAKGKIGNGRSLPTYANPGDIGRDSVLFSRCWDD